MHVEAAGPGRIIVVRETQRPDPLARHAGALTGVYQPGYLRELRDEWR